MRDAISSSVPKWPFFLGDAALVALAGLIFFARRPALAPWELFACALCVALGAALGVWPYLLDHHARVKRIETDALGSVSEKIQNLELLAAQISNATNQWQGVHLQAEKTSTNAKEITDRMAAEVRDFTAFMQKANDSEKATLRLEVEKLRRAERDWLQALVLVLDHVSALHGGAVRSGKTGVIEQLTQFRHACQEAVRRVGLVAYAPAPGDAFDPARHASADSDAVPDGGVIAEPLTVGFTLQGQVVRPALVRLAAKVTDKIVEPEPRDEAAPTPTAAQSPFTLEAPGPG